MRARELRSGAFTAFCALALAAGCRAPAPVAPTPGPICVVTAGRRTPPAVALRAEDWFGLLLCDLRHPQPVARYDACEEETGNWEPLPPQPMTAADVVVSIISRRERLVWLIWRRTANGEGIGPVVLADVEGPRAEVRAIGTLRARPENARLRLRTVGDATLLSAEGEHCLSDAPSSCRTWVRLMVKDGPSFVERPLVHEDGRCVAQAYFPLADESITPLSTGWLRRFALTSSLRYDNGVVTVHEQVVANDSDPAASATPARPFRAVEADRTIHVHNGRLEVEQRSLWSRVRTEQASVTDPDAGAPR